MLDVQMGAPLAMKDLAEMTGVSARSIRYYIQVGAVSPAAGKTRAARYSTKHVNEVAAVLGALRDGVPIAGMAANRARQRQPDAAGPGPDWPEKGKQVVFKLTSNVSLLTKPGLNAQEKRLVRRILGAAKDVLTAK